MVMTALLLLPLTASTPPPAALITATLDLASPTPPFPHFWKRSFGSGHTLLGTRADWRAALQRSVDELGVQGLRMHGALDDDLSVCPSPGQFNFYSVDLVYDHMLSLGVTPLIELSFMPRALVTCGGTHPNGSAMPRCSWAFSATGKGESSGRGSYRGLVHPPDRWGDWYDLVHAFAAHQVQRHGLDNVSKWQFEVWK
jgi:xylan 1,4-beta-xylosidase